MDAIATRLIQRGSPFELQDALIDGVQCKVFPKGPQTLLDIFCKAASFPQREFFIFDASRLSIGQVLNAASVISGQLLSQHDVRVGKRVAIVMGNCAEWVAAFVAVAALGATVVAIHVNCKGADILSALEDAQCGIVICDKSNQQRLEEIAWPGDVLLIGELSQSDTVAPIELDARVRPDAEALITFTSGTTGRAKGIVLTHRNLVTGMMNMMLGGTWMNMRSTIKPAVSSGASCTLMLSPLSYIGGYSQLLLMLYLGGKIVLLQEQNAQHAARLISQERIKSISGASAAMLEELAALDPTQHDLSTLSSLGIFGSALQTGLKERLSAAFPHVSIGTGYGMTETCGSVCVISGTELTQHPSSSGLVLPSVELRIADAHDSAMSAGETGEIWIRGAMVMKGYLGYAAAESPQYGWLKTGDLGRLDSDGRLYVLDRIKNILRWKESLISMSATEALAKSCEEVADAAVAGLAATEDGHELIMAITPHITDEHTLANIEKAILTQSNVALPQLKLIACGDLPKTISGKVKREALRQRLSNAFPQLNFHPLSQRN